MIQSPKLFFASRIVLMRPRCSALFVLFARVAEADYLATGIVNSAPFAILSGQRCMMLL
jgi:hypothetical protein